jgi:hypothetical protein
MSTGGSRNTASGDAMLGAAACVGLTVLLLAWALVVTPITWLVRTARTGLARLS